MGLLNSIKSFLADSFWRPITEESVYYNPFNTTVYAALFGLAAAYLGKPLLQRYSVSLDRRFITAIAPFIFLGGAVRSLEDMEIVSHILLVTPFIYLVMFAAFISVFLISKKIQERFDVEYHSLVAGSGLFLLAVTLSQFQFSQFGSLVTVLGIFGVLSWLTYIGGGFLDLEFDLKWFALPIAGHWFDASSSFVALRNGAEEKHVLAQFFIEQMGPVGMFALKAVIVIPAVYYINKNIDGFDRKYYLLLIALLGFALGTRNLVSLIAA